MEKEIQIGFGGGCHWCTEGVFLSLKGISEVQQGWIASREEHYETFSEAVIVRFDAEVISLEDLIAIHLYTHSADSSHSMRHKYRSAVYYFSPEQKQKAGEAIKFFQREFEKPLVTKILPFDSFRPSLPEHQNYYYSDPDKPFCKTYIHPKLKLLQEKFGNNTKI